MRFFGGTFIGGLRIVWIFAIYFFSVIYKILGRGKAREEN
jgi:hypothetical protein